MPPLTILQYLSASVGLLQAGWKFYQGMKTKLSEAERARLQAELDQAYAGFKTQMTPKEAQDAAASVAQSHLDILS